MVYGFLLTWLGTLSVCITLGELSSMVPTASGQYHWVSILAPASSKKFLSYITGALRLPPSFKSSKANVFRLVDCDGLDCWPYRHRFLRQYPNSSPRGSKRPKLPTCWMARDIALLGYSTALRCYKYHPKQCASGD